MSDGFLSPADLHKLTGRQFKSLQIVWLRDNAIPFTVSATGHPVVTWAAVNGDRAKAESAPAWKPKVLEV